MNAAPERPAGRDSAAWRDVAERLGLAPELFTTPGLDRWIADRTSALELDPASYLDRLRTDEAERRRLSAQIAVPESWIGRYPVSMDVVRDLAARAAGRGGRFRVVSLGCAAGQELYAVALAAREAGLPDRAMDLHGFDRNAEAIAQARSGRLPSLAVRSDLPETWRAHLVREGDGWQVRDDLQACVRFHEADVLRDPLPIEPGTADLVLCRNVLIYLDPMARRTLVHRAASLLMSDGLLLTGHADPPADLRSSFRPIDHAGAFAWRRITDSTSGIDSSRRRVEGDAPATPIMMRTDRPRSSAANAAPRPSEVPSVDPASTPTVELDVAVLAEIRSLADAGNLQAARRLAESLAADSPPDPRVESMLGVIASAEGRSEDARHHWRRALYLAPDHAEALEHLALLSAAHGDAEVAAGYRRRLDRLGNDSEGAS